MSKIYCISAILLVTSCAGYTFSDQNEKKEEQQTKNRSFINNDRIKFSTALTACIMCVPIQNEGYRVRVQLDSMQMESVKKTDAAEWMDLLNDTTTDWAANLILYELHEKDAFLFKMIKNRASWIKSMKEEDLAYWQKTLN